MIKTHVKALPLTLLVSVFLLFVSLYWLYNSAFITTTNGWHYDVYARGFTNLSGLEHGNNESLLITDESSYGQGRVIRLTAQGEAIEVLGNLREPDVVKIRDGKIFISEEQGDRGLSQIFNGIKQQLFPAKSLEGFDFSADKKFIYAVEDTYSGSLFRYELETKKLTTLATELKEPEGVCVTDEYVYFSEKAANRLHRINLSTHQSEMIDDDLIKPSALYCDNNSGAVWLAEERRNAGRLIRYKNNQRLVVAKFLGEPQEILASGDTLFVTDQRRGVIFRIYPDRLHVRQSLPNL